MASTGGNLLQRTRCHYFYDTATPCNKREPGSGCSAIDGLNRMHAILGASDACIATHPSDMCVALAALEAKVHVSRAGWRPHDRVRGVPPICPATHRNTTRISTPGEIITAVELPPKGFATNYTLSQDSRPALLRIRAGLGRGRVRSSRATSSRRRGFALGGVAHKPWRDLTAEQRCAGSAPMRRLSLTRPTCCCATPRATRITPSRSIWRAAPSSRALTQAARGTPQSQSDKKII